MENELQGNRGRPVRQPMQGDHVGGVGRPHGLPNPPIVRNVENGARQRDRAGSVVFGADWGAVKTYNYLPNNIENFVSAPLFAAAFRNDGRPTFGMWVPSMAQYLALDTPIRKQKVERQLPGELVTGILRLTIILLDPVCPRALPLEGELPTTWVANTFLILNRLFNGSGRLPNNFIREELMPRMFRLMKSSSIDAEAAMRLDCMRRENGNMQEISVDSGLGLIFKDLVRVDRRLQAIAEGVFKQIFKQRRCIVTIGILGCKLKVAVANAIFKGQMTVDALNEWPELIGLMPVEGQIPEGQHRGDMRGQRILHTRELDMNTDPVHSVTYYLHADYLYYLNAAAYCPLTKVKEGARYLALDGSKINTGRGPLLGHNECFSYQIDPTCFVSSGMLKCSKVVERMVQGDAMIGALQAAFHRAEHLVVNQVGVRRLQGGPAYFAEQRAFGLGEVGVAMQNRIVYANGAMMNAIFNRGNADMQRDDLMARALRPQARNRGESAANFVDRRHARNEEQNAVYRQQLLQHYANMGNIRGVAGIVNHFLALSLHCQELLQRGEEHYRRYAEWLLSRNREFLRQPLHNLNFLTLNTHGGDFETSLHDHNANNRVADDSALTTALGLIRVPINALEYGDSWNGLYLGMAPYEAGPIRADEQRLFTTPLANMLSERLRQNHGQGCYAWMRYRILEQNNLVLAPNRATNYNQQALHDQMIEPQLFLPVHGFSDLIRALLNAGIKATSRHPAPIINCVNTVMCAIHSFFNPEYLRVPQPFIKFSYLNLLFCIWTALICNLYDTCPVAGIEYILLFAVFRTHFQVLRVFQTDFRNEIPPERVPPGHHQYVLADVYSLSTAFSQCVGGIEDIEERVIRNAATMPAFREQPDQALLVSLALSIETTLIDPNRRGLKSCSLRFATRD